MLQVRCSYSTLLVSRSRTNLRQELLALQFCESPHTSDSRGCVKLHLTNGRTCPLCHSTIVFVRWCSSLGTLLDLILIYQNVGIMSDHDDKILMYG